MRSFAIVTGASSGIGFELARIAAENGHDLLIAADRDLAPAAEKLRALGGSVEASEAERHSGRVRGVGEITGAVEQGAVEIEEDREVGGLIHGQPHARLVRD